jgi:hypothetical protein
MQIDGGMAQTRASSVCPTAHAIISRRRQILGGMKDRIYELRL